MDGGQASDEELMALLQLPDFPKPFLIDNGDESEPSVIPDSQMVEDTPLPIPDAAPTAPMAPMETGDFSRPADSPVNEMITASPLSQSQSQPATIGVIAEEKEEDEDAIAYEPVKTPSRASRSNKTKTSASKPRPSHKLRVATQPRGKSKERAAVEDLKSPERTFEKPAVELEKEPANKPSSASLPPPTPPAPPAPSPPPPPSLRFDVVLENITPTAKLAYEPVLPGDEIYRILEMIPTGVPGETWVSVEFEDGHIDQVALDQLSSYPNGRQAFADYRKPKMMDNGEDDIEVGFGGRPKRKKVQNGDDDFVGEPDGDDIMEDILDEEVDDDDSGGYMHPAKRRRLQQRRNAGSARPRRGLKIVSTSDEDENESGQERRPRRNGSSKHRNRFSLRQKTSKPMPSIDLGDADELADDNDGVFIVQSDIAPQSQKKARRRGVLAVRRLDRKPGFSGNNGKIEFEAPRRSARATKATKTMLETPPDEEFDVPDEEKLPSAPRVAGAREQFPPTPVGPFKDFHNPACGTCGNDAKTPNKGAFIYCQGCSNGYHKICLGFRSNRDHIVTKIGENHFVLQCRDCINAKHKKDKRNPSLNVCQDCKHKGRSCAAFSPKRSANVEAKMREENGGEDPITPVDASLINNADNVLFRCTNCHCAYHFEHLPASTIQNNDGDMRVDRLKEYSIEWKCKHCLDMPNKISTLIAWRPVDRDAYVPGQTLLDLSEDDVEYLIQWDTMSYARCVWKPGPWVIGVTTAAMRKAFTKRNDGANMLPVFDEKDAIPEEYLLADVILDVQFKGEFRFESKQEDMQKTYLIDKALIKFEGLDYTKAVWDEPPELDSGARWTAFVSAYAEYLNGKHFKSEPFSTIKERLKQFRELDFHDNVEFEDGTNGPGEQPEALTCTLMKYQIQGTNWLLHNFWQQVSVVLADDMGLGKTVQVISLITALALQGPRCWPFLVVVPNSTCPNWRRELKKFSPDLRIVTYHGGKEAQKLAYKYELFPNGSRDMKAHVVVMSYNSAQDPETRILFKNVNWIGLVVDEGQRLKNDENLLYGALRAMKFPWRLLLTGTPLQNNKRELFNLLQFIDPSKNAARLDEKYKDMTAENIKELHAMIQPYFLRRTKENTLKFLPPMAHIILPVSMSVVQEKLCKSIMAKNPQLIRAIFANSKMKTSERSSLNNILMQLRKCLSHPFLYSGAVEDKTVDAETMHQNLVSASAKLVLLEQMLPKLKKQGHRILIFSQFLGMLDIVEDFLNGIGFKYQRLDGSLSSLQKQRRIDLFNEPGSEDFAFLLSTRAGGVGINLATADTVIILDPDFNPHQDLQAVARAHRIGQQNKVLCFQLMTKGSVEEKIMQMGRKKMALDHALIETMDREDDEPLDDLETILKHGAEALFKDDNKEVIKYDDDTLDKLLDRSQIKKREELADEEGGKPEEKRFAYAKVWENKTGGLADDIEVTEEPKLDISVWDKILKEREDEAKRLAELNKEVLGRGGRRRQAVKYNNATIGGFEDVLDKVKGSDVDDEFISDVSSASDGSADEHEAPHVGASPPTRQSAKAQDAPKRTVERQVVPPVPKSRGRSRKDTADQSSNSNQVNNPLPSNAPKQAAGDVPAGQQPGGFLPDSNLSGGQQPAAANWQVSQPGMQQYPVGYNSLYPRQGSVGQYSGAELIPRQGQQQTQFVPQGQGASRQQQAFNLHWQTPQVSQPFNSSQAFQPPPPLAMMYPYPGQQVHPSQVHADQPQAMPVDFTLQTFFIPGTGHISITHLLRAFKKRPVAAQSASAR
ncbi:hypothetical protein BD289DRAFT_484202 [Coniella lustricola]|uniref:Chromatin remodeling factor mit1 n=1 Tax=Coniella lustricola TaxID=2025994 RepID=A0A2T3A2U0_9PEZI|nr:hypothetical protein BD289DRAFT_484202 [Coniella lustricola]